MVDFPHFQPSFKQIQHSFKHIYLVFNSFYCVFNIMLKVKVRTMKHKIKLSELSNAKIFFLTLILTMLIFGIIAWIVFYIFIYKDKQTSMQNENEYWYIPDKKDNQTVLITGYNGFYPEYFCLAYYNSTDANIMFVPLPADTLCQVNTRKDILRNFYSKNNPRIICRAVESIFDVPVERYIEISPEVFNSFVTKTGHINFDLPCNLEYNNNITNEKTDIPLHLNNRVFSGSDLRKIMTYPYYSKKPDNIMYYQGFIPCMLINTFFSTSKNVYDDTDDIYINIIKHCKTNISDYDFYSKKKSLYNILQTSRKPAFYSLPEGDYNNKEQFVVSDSFKKNIKTCIDINSVL